MSLYAEYIDQQKKIWIGRKVIFKGQTHTVIDVDYNGILLIDLPAQFTPETAVDIFQLDDVL